ncbi:MAG: response regulator transcription factor [bacterium]
MIKIVLVDDNTDILQINKSVIAKINLKHDIDVHVMFFTSYNDKLEKEINDLDSRKVYILDIDLKNKVTGIDIAKKIRKIDWDSEIIFITNHGNQFENVYRNVLGVFNFIEKYNDFEQKLEHDIEKIFLKNFDNRCLVYKTSKISMSIYYRNILYVYRDTVERKIFIVTDNGRYAIKDGLNEIYELLDKRFKYSNRSCIVNVKQVLKYDWAESKFTLINGKEVYMLSKKYKEELEQI